VCRASFECRGSKDNSRGVYDLKKVGCFEQHLVVRTEMQPLFEDVVVLVQWRWIGPCFCVLIALALPHLSDNRFSRMIPMFVIRIIPNHVWNVLFMCVYLF
jgi:hypothetical protein